MARSPYIEAYRHQVAVGFTDRQYELLVEHCKKCRVSLSQAVRDAYLEKYPMPDDEKNKTLAKVCRPQRTSYETLREYRPSLGYYTRDGLLSQDRKAKFL